MREFKDKKGRLDVLISQYQANKFVGQDLTDIRSEMCSLLEELSFSDGRNTVRKIGANVEETVRRNLEAQSFRKARQKKIRA